MKMFVTRMGFNSKAVITGDVTQIDLPNARRSGLVVAMEVLKNVEGLAFAHFDETDVVRHQLVQRIVRAYDEHTARVAEQQTLLLSENKSADPTAERSISSAGREEKAVSRPSDEQTND
jgi:phosphate starvation-inducible PhoH-like protein